MQANDNTLIINKIIGNQRAIEAQFNKVIADLSKTKTDLSKITDVHFKNRCDVDELFLQCMQRYLPNLKTIHLFPFSAICEVPNDVDIVLQCNLTEDVHNHVKNIKKIFPSREIFKINSIEIKALSCKIPFDVSILDLTSFTETLILDGLTLEDSCEYGDLSNYCTDCCIVFKMGEHL